MILFDIKPKTLSISRFNVVVPLIELCQETTVSIFGFSSELERSSIGPNISL
jgi:hypothetical protein